MILQNTSFRCLACKNEWSGELVGDAYFRVVIASMQAVRCPLCHAGWKRIVIVTEPSRDDTQ